MWNKEDKEEKLGVTDVTKCRCKTLKVYVKNKETCHLFLKKTVEREDAVITLRRRVFGKLKVIQY